MDIIIYLLLSQFKVHKTKHNNNTTTTTTTKYSKEHKNATLKHDNLEEKKHIKGHRNILLFFQIKITQTVQSLHIFQSLQS